MRACAASFFLFPAAGCAAGSTVNSHRVGPFSRIVRCRGSPSWLALRGHRPLPTVDRRALLSSWKGQKCPLINRIKICSGFSSSPFFGISEASPTLSSRRITASQISSNFSKSHPNTLHPQITSLKSRPISNLRPHHCVETHLRGIKLSNLRQHHRSSSPIISAVMSFKREMESCSSCMTKIELRMRHHSKFDTLREFVLALSSEQKCWIARSPLRSILELKFVEINAVLLRHLVDGWDKESRSFNVRGSRYSFTLNEFCLITGLSAEGRFYNYRNWESCPRRSKLSILHEKRLGDKPVTIGSLIELLMLDMEETNTRNDRNVIRVFLALALCSVYFPMRGGEGVFTGIWPILDKLTSLHKYAWGKMAYEYLCDGLTEAQEIVIMRVPPQREVTVKGFTVSLQHWLLEHFPIPGKLQGDSFPFVTRSAYLRIGKKEMLNQLHRRLKIMPNLEELQGTEDDIEKLAALVAPSPSLRECFGSNVVHEGARDEGARDVADEASGERSMGDAHGQGNETPDRGQSSTTHPYDRSMCLTGSSYGRMNYCGDEEQLVSRHLVQAGSNTIVSYALPINSSDTHKLWLASHISHNLSSEEVLLLEGHRRVRTRWTHIGRPNKQIPKVWLDPLASREVASVPDLSTEVVDLYVGLLNALRRTQPIVASDCYFMETVVMGRLLDAAQDMREPHVVARDLVRFLRHHGPRTSETPDLIFVPCVTEDIINLFVVDTVNKRIFHIDPSKANHDGIVTDHLSMMLLAVIEYISGSAHED